MSEMLENRTTKLIIVSQENPAINPNIVYSTSRDNEHIDPKKRGKEQLKPAEMSITEQQGR